MLLTLPPPSTPTCLCWKCVDSLLHRYVHHFFSGSVLRDELQSRSPKLQLHPRDDASSGGGREAWLVLATTGSARRGRGPSHFPALFVGRPAKDKGKGGGRRKNKPPPPPTHHRRCQMADYFMFPSPLLPSLSRSLALSAPPPRSGVCSRPAGTV
ncbi:hypothetical protein LZ30DRAFT_417340 [Colletotrichum cereale]|nr:hypothetical protein LZ30DRAFT_417340 [Colletotrichum cereale]